MSFFADTTVTELVQANIEKVTALEEAEQKKLLAIFRRIRRELTDRLLTIPEGTFSEQQLQVTLVQIQGAILAIKQELLSGMADSSKILADKGVSDLTREITRFEKHFTGSVQPLNIDAILVASNAQNFLINKYEASLDAYSEALRSQITGQIVNSMALRETTQGTVDRLRSDVGKFFLGEEWKINRIVRTELHAMYNFSKLSGMRSIKENTLPDLKKALMHPMDSRTGEDSVALAEKNPVVEIDKPFRFTFNGEVRVFQFPPDRPNDRSIMIPFRGEWEKKSAKFSPGEE